MFHAFRFRHSVCAAATVFTSDNNMIPREFLDEAKAAAATGIPTVNILVAATHTHPAVTVAGINLEVKRSRQRPFEQIRTVAEAIADTAFEAYKRIEYQEFIPLAMRETEVELGVRVPTEAEVTRARKFDATTNVAIAQTVAWPNGGSILTQLFPLLTS